MRARYFLMALLLAGVPFAPSQAEDSPPLTLSEAVQQALRDRPLLHGDEERIGAAQARVTQARAPLLPRVDLQASATDGPLGAPALGLGGLVGTPIKKHTGGSLNLVQTLLDFGRSHNTIRARRAEVTAGQEALNADRNRVALEVQQAFFQVLQSRRMLAVTQQLLEQRRLVARQAATLMENGLATRVDVDLAELNVSQARLAAVRSQADIETAFAALSAAMGRTIPSGTPLVEVIADAPAPEPVPEPGIEESVSAAIQNRPELRQAAAQVQVYEHLTSAARAGRRPLLTGVGSVGKVNPVPLFEGSDKPWAVGLALTIPIFTGNLVEGQIEENKRAAGAQRAGLAELTNSVRQQVTAAVANLKAADEALLVSKAQVVQARDALALATQRYQSQLGSIIEVGQAQVAVATAENDLIRAQYDRELARAALAFAMGRSYPAQGAKP
jgi:outer membrane protein